jgi:hypothetical protein
MYECGKPIEGPIIPEKYWAAAEVAYGPSMRRGNEMVNP